MNLKTNHVDIDIFTREFKCSPLWLSVQGGKKRTKDLFYQSCIPLGLDF